MTYATEKQGNETEAEFNTRKSGEASHGNKPNAADRTAEEQRVKNA